MFNVRGYVRRPVPYVKTKALAHVGPGIDIAVFRFTVILISRFVIGVREASRRGSGSWTTNPSRMSDVEFLSSKLRTFALEDVAPGLYDDSDENWHDDYDDKGEPSVQVSSLDEEAIAPGSIENPQVLAGEN